MHCRVFFFSICSQPWLFCSVILCLRGAELAFSMNVLLCCTGFRHRLLADTTWWTRTPRVRVIVGLTVHCRNTDVILFSLYSVVALCQRAVALSWVFCSAISKPIHSDYVYMYVFNMDRTQCVCVCVCDCCIRDLHNVTDAPTGCSWLCSCWVTEMRACGLKRRPEALNHTSVGSDQWRVYTAVKYDEGVPCIIIIIIRGHFYFYFIQLLFIAKAMVFFYFYKQLL